MKTRLRFAIPALASLCAILAFATRAHAATMSASSTAPVANGLDIANYGTVTGTDKWFVENTADGSAKGQTFTTGAIPSLLKSVTYQVGTGNQAAPTKGYKIRVGTVSGTTFTEVYSETATQTFQWNGAEYMTWTFATPVPLTPSTLYGVDVGMTSSTTSWMTGMPYLNTTANGFSGGQFYDSGTNGIGTEVITLTSGSDRIFHLDIQHPLNPSPDFGAVVPAGNVTLSWTNLAPNTGSDVWVDVWFGTSAGAMTKVASAQQNLTSFIVNAPVANTYYWRIDSYLDGAPTGSPAQSSVFNFVVTDTDADGFPDSYELANTTPPSATGLNPGDDLEPDGLTNWQEYQLVTNPNLADTDSDGLNDGPETVGVGSRPATDPTKADTDGDGLSDGAESNTAVWVSASNTGTNPTLADTDADGLNDGVETNTGTYVSTSDTGTHPLVSDTDADGASDWYEVVIIDKKPSLGSPPNSPNDANLKPNIPYPMPDPDTSTGVTNKPVRVYIMSGQSNMVGFGQVAGNGLGTLETMTGAEKKFPNLVATGGGWTSRKDVKYQGVISDIAKGDLKPDVAGDKFGPELGFGYVMGWYHDEPVLLIKASQGNRGLMWDFLPPGSPRTVYGATTYPAYGESPETWATTGGGPSPFVWYAGKQYDDCFIKETDMGPLAWASSVSYPKDCQIRNNGVTYISKSAHTSDAASEPGVGAASATYWNVYSVFNTADILDNFASEYPAWAAQGFEIAGFVWWQGYDDQGEPRATRYEPNMVQFIKQIRSYYENRYNNDASALTKVKTNAPFVLATLATNGGWGNPDVGSGKVAQAQLNVDGAAGLHPEFAGNVKTMEARGFWRDTAISPSDQGYHYNWNAETYLLVGDALGRAMVDLESTPAGPDTTPPVIATLYPADNATGVAPATNLVITFNESIALGTGNITLKNLTDATQTTIAVTDSSQVSISGSTLTINPAADLAPSKSYAVRIDAGAVTDTSANAFAGVADDTTWNFASAIPDTTPPSISSVSPADNATGVAITANLAVTFDEPIAAGTGNITIRNLTNSSQATIAVTDAAQVSISGAILTINPTVDLVAGRDYAIRIDSGAIKDLSNNPFGGVSDDTTWNFATVPGDTTPPAIATLSPADNATDVAGGVNLAVTFNEAISIGTGLITLKNLTDATQATIAVTDAGQVSLSGSVLTINPTTDLTLGKSYAIRIDAGAVKDSSDNAFAGIADDTSWNFSTVAPDTTQPTIATLNPADNATAAAYNGNFLVTFSEAVAIGTGNITIKNLTDSTQFTIAITDGAQISVSGALLTINPTADLLAGKSYAIQIDTTAIKDLSANFFSGIGDDTTWNFTASASLTWDANAATANQTDGAGAWLNANQWWTGTANASWPPDSDAIFGKGTAGGAVTLASPTSVNSLTFNSFTGTYTLGSASQTITLNTGITKNSGSAAATIISPVTLGAAQSWTNNSTGLLTVGVATTGAINNSGHTLTVSGTGNTTIPGWISGTGGLTKSGTGVLLFNGGGGGLSNTYTGPTLVTGGVLQLGTAWNGGALSLPGGISANTGGLSNLEINGGNVRLAYYLRRALGSGPTQFQITGGTSGFSLVQADAPNTIVVNNDANYEIVWGSPYFNPTTFVLNDAAASPNGNVGLVNKLDLNGATRTVAANSATHGGTIIGVIRNSSGTAGIVKTGPGTLTLNAANTYNGDTTVSAGTLELKVANTGNNASTVTIASGATLKLTFTGTDTVDKLFIGTTPMAAGVYKAVGSVASGTELAQITGTGTLTVTSSGGAGPVDHFVVSAIGSPQTVGTAISGITITAQDASNNTATGFTGTVTFAGSGGFSGTSSSFTAGVLSGVSVTPTAAGSNLTLTVSDGAAPTPHTGAATIATIQSAYAAWAGGGSFDGDANNDGVENGIAWVLGAANANVNAVALMPTVDRTTDPNGKLLFVYRRSTAAGSDANTTIRVEYGSGLDGWTPAVHQGTGPNQITITEQTNGFATGVDKVTVLLPPSLAAGGRLFTRLKVAVTTP